MEVDNHFSKNVSEWLFQTFDKYDFVTEVYLIGSILNNFKINDVDIVQYVNLESTESLKEYAEQLKLIKVDFLDTFNTELHITSFTKKESSDFNKFMSKNDFKKLI